MGEACADLAIEFARELKQPDFVEFVLAAIVRNGELGGTELGFLQRIGSYAYAGSHN